MYKIFCVLSSIFLYLLMQTRSCVCFNSPKLRQTLNGPVEGIQRISVLGQKYYAFEGIPYAEAPITGIDPYTGERVDRRFKAPEALKRKWSEPLKVHNFGRACMPTETMPTENDQRNMSEDCLFIDVYVPANGMSMKTVLAFIHGGGEFGGVTLNSQWGPDFFLSQDNIVVKIEYRVQKFGFMNLDYGEYTGNMALKDQQLALKWIHENIENFSGKKDEVLLFGSSLGGRHVHLHMLNEKSREYFKRAFCMSGNVFTSVTLRKANHVQLMQKCFGIKEMGRLINHLKIANNSDLFECTRSYSVITIESPSTKGAFLTQTPEEIYSSDKPPIMDVMFSFTSMEAIQAFPKLLHDTKAVIETDWIKAHILLRYENFSETDYPKEYKQVVEKLRAAYFNNLTNVETIRSQNIAFVSDLHLGDSVLKSSVLHAKISDNTTNSGRQKNTFIYRFSVNTELNLFRTNFKDLYYNGATHSDDLNYMFYFPNVDKHLERKDYIYDIIMRSVKMVTNFARHGDPSIEGDNPFRSCKSSDEIYCQEVSTDPKTRVIYDIKQQLHYNLWREIDEIVAMKNRTTIDNKCSRHSQQNSILMICIFLFHQFLLHVF